MHDAYPFTYEKNRPEPVLKTNNHNAKEHKKSAQSRNRTGDIRIFSPPLYQLSYLGTSCGGRI